VPREADALRWLIQEECRRRDLRWPADDALPEQAAPAAVLKSTGIAWPEEGAEEGESAPASRPVPPDKDEDERRPAPNGSHQAKVPRARLPAEKGADEDRRLAPSPPPAAEERGSGPGAGPACRTGVPSTPARPPAASGDRPAREGASGVHRGVAVHGTPPPSGGPGKRWTSGPAPTPRKKAP